MNFLPVIIFALCLVLFVGQTEKPRSPGGVDWCANSWGSGHLETRLLKQPDSPLKLQLSGNRRFVMLSNVSDREVAEFRLGVFDPKANRFVAQDEWTPQDLLPHHFLSDLGETVEKLLVKQKGRCKVGIVEVRFSDGTTWSAPVANASR